MPKVEIDYSNTLIYKITCKDVTITDVYVGHTTNFVQRKYAHKQNCIKEQCKLYTTIRNNGGWANWTMEIIGFFNCKDHYEARQKEQEYFELLHATLNSIEPMPKPKLVSKTKHITDVNIKKTVFYCGKLVNSESDQKTQQYFCEKCNFNCCKIYSWDRHLSTLKHKTETNKVKIMLSCKNCDKKFKNRSGLWKHKPKCVSNDNSTIIVINETAQETTNKDEMIMLLLKQNSDLIKEQANINKMMLELINNKNSL
jgi:hypothetical protein